MSKLKGQLYSSTKVIQYTLKIIQMALTRVGTKAIRGVSLFARVFYAKLFKTIKEVGSDPQYPSAWPHHGAWLHLDGQQDESGRSQTWLVLNRSWYGRPSRQKYLQPSQNRSQRHIQGNSVHCRWLHAAESSNAVDCILSRTQFVKVQIVYSTGNCSRLYCQH